LPIGVSFIGPAWSEGPLLGMAYAYEQRTKARRAPEYLPSALWRVSR
jgi:amidase